MFFPVLNVISPDFFNVFFLLFLLVDKPLHLTGKGTSLVDKPLHLVDKQFSGIILRGFISDSSISSELFPHHE